MTIYVAMLRAINLGRHNKIRMPELKALFEALGHSAVTTYVQSGNVVFTSSVDRPDDVAEGIQSRIAAELGLDVPVIIRSGPEMAGIVAGNPFTPPMADLARVYVTFLTAAPDPDRVDGLVVAGAEPDEFQVSGRDVYVHCPGGFGQTKLNNGLWERRLRVTATSRNWNTVTKLAELSAAPPWPGDDHPQ